MKSLANKIEKSKHTIIFTGAGMSTESGLPDFRSKSRGLWKKFNPEELANVHALLSNEEEFTNFYRYRLTEITKYAPHRGHEILGEWEGRGYINGIITQNVDGFHSIAGSENVMELHGSFNDLHCHECHKSHPRELYLDGQSKCLHCAGTVRPGIVLFGESLPEDVFHKAEEESIGADLFIVLGSSLSVTPANMFPLISKEKGAELVIINWEATDLDLYADQTIHKRNIKEVLIELDNLLSSK